VSICSFYRFLPITRSSLLRVRRIIIIVLDITVVEPPFAGDTIMAYAGKYGALGCGPIKAPSSYKLLEPGCREDVRNEIHLHRLRIEWKYAIDKIEDAISLGRLLKEYGIHHPRSTSVRIGPEEARRLVADMADSPRFSAI